MLDTKKTLLSAMVLIAASASLEALAHTDIEFTVKADDKGSTVKESNNIIIGHGCKDEKGKTHPVIAQSILFPTISPDIFEGSSSTPSTTLKVSDIFNIESLALAGFNLIQSNDVFSKQSEKYDNTEKNVIGFTNTKGNLDIKLHGLVPFRTGVMSFKSNTPGACFSKVNIKVAIADICKVSFPSNTGPKVGDANLWIPKTTTKFKNEQIEGIGEPATLTINNPACTGGSIVTISPSDEDIDANLPFKGWGK